MLVLTLLGSGCLSVADTPRLPPEVLERIRIAPPPHFRAHLDCESNPAGRDVGCEETLANVKRVLASSPWFDTVNAERAEATLLLSIEPMDRGPLLDSPVKPLLMVVLPIPDEFRAGYCMTATIPGRDATAQIDTRRKLTGITWSLAPLLNLLPSRSFGVTAENELQRIQAQLLPLVEPKP